MELSRGDKVTAPDGKIGEVLDEKVHEQMHFKKGSGGAVIAYPVLMDDGEVRFYTAEAFDTPPGVIRRSGSLKR